MEPHEQGDENISKCNRHKNTEGYNSPSPVPRLPPSPRGTSAQTEAPSENYSLDSILDTPELVQAFRSFLAKSYCSENLEFYGVVEGFRRSWPQRADALPLAERKGMTDTALHIWCQYLAPTAENQVNVDSAVLEGIEAKLESPCTNMFDDAQTAVKALMMENWFGRFIRSPEFRITRELMQVQSQIDSEQARIRKWLKKVGRSERAVQKLKERKQELESQLSSPALSSSSISVFGKNPTSRALSSTPVVSITDTAGVRSPVLSSSSAPAPSPAPDSATPSKIHTFLSTNEPLSPRLVHTTTPVVQTDSVDSSSSSLSSSPPSSSSSSSSSTTSTSSLRNTAPPQATRHAKKNSWSAMLPVSVFEKRSKTADQAIGAKKSTTLRARHKESPGDWILVIGVIQAKQLVPREKEAGLNAYVVLKYGRQKFQTSIAALSDRSPRWREHFLFHVGKEDEGGVVSITVRNHSVLGGQTLGRLKFASPRMLANKSDQWWTLEPRKDGEVVTGKLRLQTHYRMQGTKEQELRKLLKQVKRFIEEEEIEIIKEEQWRKKRQSNLTASWASKDDAAAPRGHSLSVPPKDRRRSEVLTLPKGLASPLGHGGAVPANKVIRNLMERRTKLEKELQVELERCREAGEEPNAPTATTTTEEEGAAVMRARAITRDPFRGYPLERPDHSFE